MKQFNIFFSICVGLLLLGFLYLTLDFPADVWAVRFGPAFYPITIVCALVLLLILFFIENRQTINSEKIFKKEQMRHPLFLGAAFLVLIFLLEPLGFPLCGVVFLFATTYLLGTSCKVSLILAAAVTGTIYIMFKLVLNVPLPMGTLWEGLS